MNTTSSQPSSGGTATAVVGGFERTLIAAREGSIVSVGYGGHRAFQVRDADGAPVGEPRVDLAGAFRTLSQRVDQARMAHAPAQLPERERPH